MAFTKKQNIPREEVALLLLAGGKSRRMNGQNKGLLRVQGRSLLEFQLERLQPELTGLEVLISANTNLAEYSHYGYPVVEDVLPGHLGPLSGIYSAMQHTQRHWILSLPCDIPNIPRDYLPRMLNMAKQPGLAQFARSQRDHYACCLLSCSLRDDILQRLQRQQLAMYDLLDAHHAQVVDFSDRPDAFYNINTPQQLKDFVPHD